MSSTEEFSRLLARKDPLLALAPMQDVTDLPFWGLMARYGGPDVYWTEYHRVHSASTLERSIHESLTQNRTGRPAIAQLIGNDVPALVRAARELQQYPIAAVDFNLGCPAPVVYRKCAGGGLLREPKRIDAILGALREAIGERGIRFTVKTRIGFDDPAVFEELLCLFAKHSVDLLTVHGRTVLEMYRTEVHYDYIARAVEVMSCPVLANGNIHSADRAASVLQATGASGLMIGRGCIRNPWIFDQIRAQLRGEAPVLPTGRAVLAYVEDLYRTTEPPVARERLQIEKMKKYMNYVGAGIGTSAPELGAFLHRIRRVTTRAEFFQTCGDFLDHDDPMPLVPLEPDAISSM